MKRNAGVAIAVALAITAAARIPAGRSASVSTQVQAANHALGPAHPHRPPSHSGYSGGCSAYDRADEKALPDDNRSAAKSVLDRFLATAPSRETAQTLRNEPGVRYAIALAADPRHTNLSLVFDRQMASIEQAAQDEDYTYDSSWLPWSVDKPSYALVADQQNADELASRRGACPGVLLFRKSTDEPGPGNSPGAVHPYRQALIVLVVGEQPTGGINQDQWANAIHWLQDNASDGEQDRLGPAPRMLRILGPSFSGTLVSLGRQLQTLYPVEPAAPAAPGSFAARFPRASVLSGSVSECNSVRWFQQLVWPRAPGGAAPALSFGSFEENDALQIFRLLSYLQSQGTAADDTVILSEDETAYSGNLAEETRTGARSCGFPYEEGHRPVRLFFPRDISALRNAYEKESIFAASTSTRGEHTVHTILQEGGSPSDEGGNPSDTIQAYSGHLTPIAQEASLYALVSYMRAHHTRYLLLRCTNPLDFLFLTRFFHRAYPEGRIVTVGSDLLFRREVDTTEFRGVLSLSNYPLLPRNQHWSMVSEHARLVPGHAHRAFDTGTVEGAYLAARYLFSSGSELAHAVTHPGQTYLSLPLKESLPEYADPFWLHRPRDVLHEFRAPNWLVAVGRDGYWPIAVLTDESTPQPFARQGSPPPSTMVRLTSELAHYDLDPDRRHYNKSLRSSLPLAWTLCATLACVLLIYQVVGILLGDTSHSNGLFSAFRKVDAPSQDLLLGCNSAFATLVLGSLLSVSRMTPWGAMFVSADGELLAFLLLGLLGVMAIAVSLFWKRGSLDPAPNPAPNWFWRRGWLAVLSYFATLLVLGRLSLWTLDAMIIAGKAPSLAKTIPLFYRMGHLTSGVAPLLPVLFVLSGYYLWSWHAMAGNVLLCNGRPKLPMLAGEPALSGMKRWYWILLGNPVEPTLAGENRLSASETRMSQKMGKGIVAMASPLGVSYGIVFLPICLLAGSWVCFHRDLPLLTLEGVAFSRWLNLSLLLAVLLIATEASRLFWTWIELRRLLSKLGRLRLRRTFARLRAIEASSLWSMSGSVQRVQYRFFSEQLEAGRRLATLTGTAGPYLTDAVACGDALDTPGERGLNKGSRWTVPLPRPSGGSPLTIRDAFSDAVAEVLNRILIPAWSQETTSLNLVAEGPLAGDEQSRVLLPLDAKPVTCAAEEFVCFHYIAFIQNILARMRTMTLSMILLFLAVSLAISFYPFVPRTQISMWMILNLAVIGSAVVYVYAGLDRDEIISYITNTRPGRLSTEFWIKSAAFLAGPIIGIITTQFPAVAESVLGWVQPGLDAIGK